MQGSQQSAGRRGRARALLSRNREALARDVLAGLLVLGLPPSIGLVLGADPVVSVAVAALSAAVVAFVAGVLYGRRSRQPEGQVIDRPPAAGPGLPGVEEMEKILLYADYFAPAGQLLQLGRLEEVEAELLIRPARLLEQRNGGSVQLAVFDPVEAKDREPAWHLPYVAGISPGECREFEVPLKGSQLAQMQMRWEPQDQVMVVSDLQEHRWRKSGADFEAFAKAGFRMLRFLPFGPPGVDGTRACIVLLSKEAETSFTGVDDFCLMYLGTLLSMHALLAERARLLSEGGASSE